MRETASIVEMKGKEKMQAQLIAISPRLRRLPCGKAPAPVRQSASAIDPRYDFPAALPPAVRDGSAGVKKSGCHGNAPKCLAAMSFQILNFKFEIRPSPVAERFFHAFSAFSGRYHSPFLPAAPPSRDRPNFALRIATRLNCAPDIMIELVEFNHRYAMESQPVKFAAPPRWIAADTAGLEQRKDPHECLKSESSMSSKPPTI
jgi:hypothetical protein